MSDRDPLLFVEDIIEAIEKIERYTMNLTLDTFERNELVIDAVIRNFEIIGEAANNLTSDIYEKYHNVEWRKIIDFRNVMIHAYFGIMYSTVWNTIKNNIPVLKDQMLIIKAELDRNSLT
jgi:uncharacterized protein with HEPN domain